MHEVPTTVRSRDLVIQRRQQIAEASYAVFREKGFKSSTVEEIAARLSIDKATLYGYIERKEDLLYLVFCHYIPIQTERLGRAARRVRDPRVRLEAIIDEQMNIVDEYRDFVLLTYRELRYLHRDAISSVFELMHKNHAVYVSALSDGVADGQFETIDVSIATHALLSMIYMWAPFRRDLDWHGREEVRETVKRIFFKGVARRRPATSRRAAP